MEPKAMQPFRNQPLNINVTEFAKPVQVHAKPGDIICEACGKPITEDQLSKDPMKRAYQKKWHLHDACYERTNSEIDKFSGEEDRNKPRFYETPIDKGYIATERF